PPEASAAWSTTGLDGARRFLDRIWRLIVADDGSLSDKIQDVTGGELEKVYHQTVKKVTEDCEAMHCNTAISQLMVSINEAYKAEVLPKKYMEGFVKMLSPIAPHIAEELWEKLGHEGTVSYEAWPQYDETKLVSEEVEIVVQVNGKVRTKLMVSREAGKGELEEIALNDDKIK